MVAKVPVLEHASIASRCSASVSDACADLHRTGFWPYRYSIRPIQLTPDGPPIVMPSKLVAIEAVEALGRVHMLLSPEQRVPTRAGMAQACSDKGSVRSASQQDSDVAQACTERRAHSNSQPDQLTKRLYMDSPSSITRFVARHWPPISARTTYHHRSQSSRKTVLAGTRAAAKCCGAEPLGAH